PAAFVGIHHPLLSPGRDVPNLLLWRLREIDPALVRHTKIVTIDLFRDRTFIALTVIGDDPFFSILTGVEFAVGPEHESVGAAGALLEHGDVSVQPNLV